MSRFSAWDVTGLIVWSIITVMCHRVADMKPVDRVTGEAVLCGMASFAGAVWCLARILGARSQ